MQPYPKNNTGKVHARYLKSVGSSTLVLNLRPHEATALRSFIASIRLRGDKVPSLSLVARRAVSAYLAHVQFSPETRASEIDVLEKLATPFTNRAPSKVPAA